MAKQNISLSVIKRLPKYYRYLESINEKGIIRVSSKELSDITGLTASQIRQDLNHFGCFGQQGYGYNAVSYTHLTLPTTCTRCRSRWSPYH